MSSLLYFLETSNQGLVDAQAQGLGYALEKAMHQVGLSRGPGGRAGVLLAAADRLPVERCRADESAQTWLPVPAALRSGLLPAWVGRWNNAPIAPEDLARPRQLGGHWTELGDAQRWLVPVARAWGDGGYRCALPMRIGLDAAGQWDVKKPVQRYARLWDLATAWWDAKIAGAVENPQASSLLKEKPQVSFDFAGLMDAALEVLAANYRVGRVEVDLLELFSGSAAGAIMDALVDWPVIQAWLEDEAKKKADPPPAASAGTAGPAA